LEFLPILYALLAAITGIHAGDRSLAAVSAPMESSIARDWAVEEVRSIAAVRVSARPVAPLYPALFAQRSAPLAAAVPLQRLFAIAHFSVRRE